MLDSFKDKPQTIMTGLSSKRDSVIVINDPVACFGSDHIYNPSMGKLILKQVPPSNKHTSVCRQTF